MRTLAILFATLSEIPRAVRVFFEAIGDAQKQAVQDYEFESKIFANESTTLEKILGIPLGFSFANEFSADNDRESWVQLAPFGKWDNKQGMQVFDRAAAEIVIENFANAKLWTAPGVAMFGIPWYIGHPDHPDFKTRDTNQRAYGRIKKLEVREGGLFANVKWSREGAEMVRDQEFHGHSVVWHLAPVTGKSREFRPVALQSVGFTNNPNIPVEPARLGANETETNMEFLAKLIANLKLAANATEQDVLTSVQALLVAANERAETLKKAGVETDQALLGLLEKNTQTIAANEKAIQEANGKITGLETEKSTLTNQVATLTSENTTAKQLFANERKARVEALVGAGVQDGRITEADKPTWVATFANEGEFESNLGKFNALTPKVKTGGALNLGTRKVGTVVSTLSEPGNQLRAKADQIFANEKPNGITWDQAWNRAKTENPALVQAMENKTGK